MAEWSVSGESLRIAGQSQGSYDYYLAACFNCGLSFPDSDANVASERIEESYSGQA